MNGFENFLKVIETYSSELQAIGAEPPPAPRWDQDWFPRLDAAAAYAMVRETRPARIVEVGSGHSTRFLARAVADGGLDTRITCIDPQPRASISGLKVDFLKMEVQQAKPSIFKSLAASDILFIDSSHQ
ncbi:MAG: class I SAM-dependent methyltransferase, partial [Pseudomonadota bacterium]